MYPERLSSLTTRAVIEHEHEQIGKRTVFGRVYSKLNGALRHESNAQAASSQVETGKKTKLVARSGGQHGPEFLKAIDHFHGFYLNAVNMSEGKMKAALISEFNAEHPAYNITEQALFQT